MRLLDCFSCAFVTQLRQAMGKPGLHLVIGGKSLGKTKIVQTIVDNAGDEAPLLYVNMRLPPVPSSDDLLQCLQAEGKRRWNSENAPPWLTDAATVARAVLATVAGADFKKSELLEGGVAPVRYQVT